MTRLTRSKRTKFDFSKLTQNLPDVTNETTSRVPNVQTRRSSAQTSRQEEESPLKAKLTSIWSAVKSHKDTSVPYRSRVYAKLFMSLPDKKMYPDYYEEIKNPVSLDIIKQKLVDGEYPDEEAFSADLELMCENAKKYNVEGSQIHNDAIILQKLARKLLKGDTEEDTEGNTEEDTEEDNENNVVTYHDEVEHNGEIYQVGDYVHIFNEADPSKPNVAHIHKIWVNNKGVTGIYVCWYYHPEQTKHQATHKFYENEVFKTNTFHDHSFDDVMEKCFVLQYKDYVSGRPKGSEGMSVYLCESRYNEHQKNFNKIKSWASTIPDGAPLKKMELVKFNEVIVPRKVESALAAGLRKTIRKTKAKEDRKVLQTQSKYNKYEYDADSSYPEDPFPSSRVTPVRIRNRTVRNRNVRLGRPRKRQTPISYRHPQSYQTTYDDSDHYTSYASSGAVHSPYPMTSGYPITSTPLTEDVQNTGMPHQYEFVASPHEIHEMPISIPPIPPQHQFMPQQYYQEPSPVVQQTTPVVQSQVMPNSPVVSNHVMPNHVMLNHAIPNHTMSNHSMSNHNMSNRHVMSNSKSIISHHNHRLGSMLDLPPETADYFACDEEGNVLWFPSPPIDIAQLTQPMHSIEYLHRREEIMRENDKKRKFQETTLFHSNNNTTVITESQTLHLKESDLVSSIDELGDRWKNDANLLNQRLHGNYPDYYEEV